MTVTSPAQPNALTQRGSRGNGAWRLSLLLLAAGVALHEDFLLAVALSLIALLGCAWAWNALSLRRVIYERAFRSQDDRVGLTHETRAFLGETVELILRVRNAQPIPLSWLEIVDTLPDTLPLDSADSSSSADPLPPSDPTIAQQARSMRRALRMAWRISPHQTLTRHYTLRCTQRGYHTFGPAQLTSGDGFGFFQSRIHLRDAQRLIIYPRVYTAAELRLPANYPFGERATQQRLFEDPLRPAGARLWVPDDGLRRIHWKATARQQRLLSRIYEPSQEPQALIALNMATLPRHWEGIIPELLERTISVAGSLAVLLAEMRLPVGLIANGYWPGSDQTLRLMPGRSPEQVMRILEMLAAVSGFADRALEDMLLREAPRLPWGSTLLVVTPIAPPPLLETLHALSGRGLQLVLFTLAEELPAALPGVRTYHLAHLITDLTPVLLFSEAATS